MAMPLMVFIRQVERSDNCQKDSVKMLYLFKSNNTTCSTR